MLGLGGSVIISMSSSNSNNASDGFFDVVYDEWPAVKVFGLVIYLLTETLGNALLAGIVWYERCGSDSYFRTIINQVGIEDLSAKAFWDVWGISAYCMVHSYMLKYGWRAVWKWEYVH